MDESLKYIVSAVVGGAVLLWVCSMLYALARSSIADDCVRMGKFSHNGKVYVCEPQQHQSGEKQ